MTPEELKPKHDELQQGLNGNEIRIREGIVLDVGYDVYPRFGFEFFCWRSPECVKEMDAFVKYAKGKKCLLDIGSYHGLFSLVFTEINKGGVAYAFEPFAEPFGILSGQIVGKPIAATQAALNDQTGKLKLYEANGHLNEVDIYKEGKVQYVNAITGDAFCFGMYPNIAPDILKIDCEAGELKVLRGLNNILTKHRPTIFLEIHYSQLSSEDVISIMEIIGFLEYKIIDTETDKPITLSSLLKPTQGEKRIVLL